MKEGQRTRTKHVRELDVPLVVCPFRWFFCLLGHGFFHFVPCIPPFFGCFVLFMIGKVSLSCKGKVGCLLLDVRGHLFGPLGQAMSFKGLDNLKVQ
jgi:hypothetical protein